MRLVCQSDGRTITLDAGSRLGGGGEAHVYALPQDGGVVAKLYHAPSGAYARKLTAMLANPPDDLVTAQGHTSIAWPTDLLLGAVDGRQVVVGFLMPRVIGLDPIINFYNPGMRRKRSPLFSYYYLHHAARNLASAARALHARGYVIGDVNESNILVAETALVTLVDTDSFQVTDARDRTVYRCPVGKPEYTPPELQGKAFRDIDRSAEQDLFGLAALIFQLLMEGVHPFSGAYTGPGDPPSLEDRIRSGDFTHGKRRVPYRPMPIAPPIDILHPRLRELFVRCFEEGHSDPRARPDAQTWQNAIDEAEAGLETCRANSQHRYGSHLRACPWCARTALLGGRDPFPSRQAVRSGQHFQTARPMQTPSPPPIRTAPRVRPRPRVTRQQAVWIAVGVVLVFLLFPNVGGYLSGMARLQSAPPNSRSAAGTPRIALTRFGLGHRAGEGRVNPKDGAAMVWIPAGAFTMGSGDSATGASDDEKPAHKVDLDGYWIYKTPVTVAQYRKFCDASGRSMPDAPSWGWKDDHPVVNVTWDDATAYAAWAGARLPTEAEWEKAARGTDGRIYPWGNQWDAGRLQSSVGSSAGSTASVTAHPSGASPYGALDMAGNVWQWCADYYGADYYKTSPARNPRGPGSGDTRVLRGGSWTNNDTAYFRAALRLRLAPAFSDVTYGFRCAAGP